MDPNQPDPNRSFGRGRPMENCDLRRPFNYTYAPEVQYVPAEGSSNIMQLNNTMGDMTRQAVVHNGDVGVFHVGPGGEFVHSQNAVSNNTGNEKSGSEINSVLSPYAREFVPRNFRMEPRTSQVLASPTVDSSNDSYPIQKLRQFLFEITLNPGKFESKIESLIDCLNDHISCGEMMRAVVNIVFDESVRQPNFRYNGARLSKYLSKDLMTPNSSASFFQMLVARCKQEYNRREELLNADDGGTYLRGLAMYLAELFSQVELSQQKVLIWAEFLTDVIGTLLSNKATDNLKCVCQVLKLVGVYLEDQERSRSGSAPEMDKIMNTLSGIAENKEFPNDIRSMVSNVVDLRSSNWGRASEEETVVEEVPPPTTLNEPVMYGPDGKPISDEESIFLHSQYSNNLSDAEEYDAIEDDEAYEEMSDELLAAYEVYLNEMSR